LGKKKAKRGKGGRFGGNMLFVGKKRRKISTAGKLPKRRLAGEEKTTEGFGKRWNQKKK